MENINCNQNSSEAAAIMACQSFEKTPVWGEFFYFAKDRASLIALYESFLNAGFTALESPHETASTIFVAKLVDPKGHHILLRTK
jgi:hypothetical protein